MKAASLKEIKLELGGIPPQQLVEICLRLAKFKKENKELLTYLLFQSLDESQYIEEVKIQIDELFASVKRSNLYLAKKTIRKILRTLNKFIKYSGLKQTEVELLIYFCRKLKSAELPLYVNSVLGNIYLRQIERIKKLLSVLHEDLQLDYQEDLRSLL